jgi:hypothetical protein
MRYNNNKVTPIINNTDSGNRYYQNILPPSITESEDDIFIITKIGDRLDLLANRYYLDPTLWWIIPSANPELSTDSFYLTPGIQLRIPKNSSAAITEMKQQNEL